MARVAVVGSGFIGRAWAITFARAGHDVALWDQDPEAPHRAIDFIASVAPDLAANNLLGGATPEALLARLRAEKTLAAALADADHVQENAPERLDVKTAIFSELDRLAPQTAVLASSSSAILPSRFTEHLAHRQRCLVIHPINPPYLIPAAELVPAPWTTAETVERARAFLIAAGQAPIVMKRELDGFVMNRMQGALLEEAFRLVADGFASGRSWARSRRSTSTLPRACATMSRDTRASTPTCSSRCSGASIGRAQCLAKWKASAAPSSRPISLSSVRNGETVA
jgi:L-gulonate 3-dehydrogenase